VLKHRDMEASYIQLDEKEDLGYALVCKDGPVFNLEEVLFDE
jgi:NAD(P)H-flavin reductase